MACFQLAIFTPMQAFLEIITLALFLQSKFYLWWASPFEPVPRTLPLGESVTLAPGKPGKLDARM
jgi:hypothetical protein